MLIVLLSSSLKVEEISYAKCVTQCYVHVRVNIKTYQAFNAVVLELVHCHIVALDLGRRLFIFESWHCRRAMFQKETVIEFCPLLEKAVQTNKDKSSHAE